MRDHREPARQVAGVVASSSGVDQVCERAVVHRPDGLGAGVSSARPQVRRVHQHPLDASVAARGGHAAPGDEHCRRRAAHDAEAAARVHKLVNNPVYAGAYAFGRTECRVSAQAHPAEQCSTRSSSRWPTAASDLLVYWQGGDDSHLSVSATIRVSTAVPHAEGSRAKSAIAGCRTGPASTTLWTENLACSFRNLRGVAVYHPTRWPIVANSH